MRGMRMIVTRWGPLVLIGALLAAGLLWAGSGPLRLAAAAVAAAATAAAAETTARAAAARAAAGGDRASSRAQLAALAVAGAGVAVTCSGSSSNIGWFALVVLLAWAVLAAGPSAGAVGLGAALVLFAVEWGVEVRDPGWAAWVGGSTFTVIGSALIRRQYELTEALRAAQSGLAERARAEERNRIAREIHDVVAHTLTVSLLYVSGARLALDEDVTEAARALEEAERLGRAALTEVRQAVGLLREPAGGVGAGGRPPAPLPAAEALDELVDGFRRAGATVTFSVDGQRERLPSTVGLTVHNILREALTNSARHAPGGTTTARLEIGAVQVTLTVDTVPATPLASSTPAPSSAPSQAPSQARAGLGLPGMRERARALGGICQAGPSGTGWRVVATIPLVTAPASQPAPLVSAPAARR